MVVYMAMALQHVFWFRAAGWWQQKCAAAYRQEKQKKMCATRAAIGARLDSWPMGFMYMHIFSLAEFRWRWQLVLGKFPA